MNTTHIECDCGTKINVKKGVVQVNCRCGRVYTICRDGKPKLAYKIAEQELLSRRPK